MVIHLVYKLIVQEYKGFCIYRSLYMKIGESAKRDQKGVYEKKVEELRPSLRFCAYNIGDETAMQDLMTMQGQGRDMGDIDVG